MRIWRKITPLGTTALLFIAGACGEDKVQKQNNVKGETAMAASVHAFTVKDIADNDVDLSMYRGKALLIVNVASKCGFTKQYADLQKLYEQYRDRGLVVLGFPANNFARQEPGTNEEIARFCSVSFGVTFPMFAKISVAGNDIHPLYAYLTSQPSAPAKAGKISWNFNKFVIDAEGRVTARFGSRAAPLSQDLLEAIEKVLPQP